MPKPLDAVIVGSGPNGLAAAVALAQAGCSVLVREAQPQIGGGTRTAELTLPGFRHDLCSAVHPLGIGSPFFERLPLARHGLEWIHPPLPLAHPLDGGRAAVAHLSLEETARGLGRDGRAYAKLFGPFSTHWEQLAGDALKPVGLPRHPLLMARFGLQAVRSVQGLADAHFKGEEARALVAGVGGHSILDFNRAASAAVVMMLGTALHARGWPIPRGGSQKIADALAALLTSLGGRIETDARVSSLSDLPPARAVLWDVTPRQLLKIFDHAGSREKLSPSYRGQLEDFRYGPGVFKIDWALSAPIPWANRECARAGTIHLGGTLEELAASERAPWENKHAERPYVLLAQPSLFDDSRAPAGKHVAWAYCHVPHGSTQDMTARIEAQVERFAPGFSGLVLARATADTRQLEARNENLVGGDIGGGAADLGQLFLRPAARVNPYSLPVDGHFICSSSTPPGPGVHGMCGYFAAQAALKRLA